MEKMRVEMLKDAHGSQQFVNGLDNFIEQKIKNMEKQ